MRERFETTAIESYAIEVARLIQKVSGLDFAPPTNLVRAVFDTPLKVENPGTLALFSSKESKAPERLVLTRVTLKPAGINISQYARSIFRWIPQVKDNPPNNSPQERVLDLFGIRKLEDFTDVGPYEGFRAPKRPSPTMMEKGHVDGTFVFGGDNRFRDKFTELKQVVWAIAMFPPESLEAALRSHRHVLLLAAKENISPPPGDKMIREPFILARITRAGKVNWVEIFDAEARDRYVVVVESLATKNPEIDTPVLIFQYN